jgi:hypothetical protein
MCPKMGKWEGKSSLTTEGLGQGYFLVGPEVKKLTTWTIYSPKGDPVLWNSRLPSTADGLIFLSSFNPLWLEGRDTLILSALAILLNVGTKVLLRSPDMSIEVFFTHNTACRSLFSRLFPKNLHSHFRIRFQRFQCYLVLSLLPNNRTESPRRSPSSHKK